MKSLAEASLEGLQWLANNRGLITAEKVGEIANSLKDGADAVEGALDKNPAQLVRSAVEMAALPQLGFVLAVVEAAAKASGLSDAEINTIKDLATNDALKAATGYKFPKSADSTDLAKAAANAAHAGLDGGTVSGRALADSIAGFLASEQGQEVVKSAANAGLNTATGAGLALADSIARFLASEQGQEVVKSAADAGLATATSGALSLADSMGRFLASESGRQVVKQAAEAAAVGGATAIRIIIDGMYHSLDGGHTWLLNKGTLFESADGSQVKNAEAVMANARQKYLSLVEQERLLSEQASKLLRQVSEKEQHSRELLTHQEQSSRELVEAGKNALSSAASESEHQSRADLMSALFMQGFLQSLANMSERQREQAYQRFLAKQRAQNRKMLQELQQRSQERTKTTSPSTNASTCPPANSELQPSWEELQASRCEPFLRRCTDSCKAASPNFSTSFTALQTIIQCTNGCMDSGFRSCMQTLALTKPKSACE